VHLLQLVYLIENIPELGSIEIFSFYDMTYGRKRNKPPLY